jgi:DNA-binding MarR family transcriptional regulator
MPRYADLATLFCVTTKHQGVRVDATESNASSGTLESALRIAIMRFGRRLRTERSDNTLGLSQLSALATLHRFGSLSPTALADIERIQPPSMTRVITGLEQRGLAVRKPHPTDRRQAVIAISEAGRAIVEEDQTRRQAWLSGVLERLTEDERVTLRAALPILERLVDQ